MRVAVIHDWLVQYAGAERVLREILEEFPGATLFTLVDFLPKESRAFLQDVVINTSFIQRLPFAKAKYRSYFPLMPLAIEAFDLSRFDLIISSHHSVAKGVIVGPDQVHICYCHSPARYAWDLQHEYFARAKIGWGLKGGITHYLLHKMRNWDVRTAGVDHFIAVSEFIQKRIRRVYGRESTCIYPPVAVDQFEVKEQKENFYLAASRLVPYKSIDLIVEAFRKMPNKRLVVIGDGPQYKMIQRKAGPNVQLMGYQSDGVLKDYMQRARAFIFAAREDFGIIPVEAQACGTPVIGYGFGGVRETVENGKTGLLFHEQSAEAICRAVRDFESLEISADACRKNAERFSTARFRREFREFVDQVLYAARPV